MSALFEKGISVGTAVGKAPFDGDVLGVLKTYGYHENDGDACALKNTLR